MNKPDICFQQVQLARLCKMTFVGSAQRISLHIALFQHWCKYIICFKQFTPRV